MYKVAQIESAADGGLGRLRANVVAWEATASSIQSTFPLEEVFAGFIPKNADCVVDYGCGEGRVARWLTEIGVTKIVGYDTSKTMCVRARSENPEADFYQTSSDLPAPQGSPRCDRLVLIGVLSSIPTKILRRRFLSNLATWLGFGGVLYLADFGVSEDPFYQQRYETEGEGSTSFTSTSGVRIHHFQQTELRRMLPNSLSVLRTRTISVRTLHGRNVPGHIIVAKRA